MQLSMLLLVQAASLPPATVIDLKTPTAKCAPKDDDEVVVCGSRGARSPYRLPELPTKYEPKPKIAETQLAHGVKGRLAIESVELPGGGKSDRAMVRITVGF